MRRMIRKRDANGDWFLWGFVDRYKVGHGLSKDAHTDNRYVHRSEMLTVSAGFS